MRINQYDNLWMKGLKGRLFIFVFLLSKCINLITEEVTQICCLPMQQVLILEKSPGQSVAGFLGEDG
jgi:hypothetical protein